MEKASDLVGIIPAAGIGSRLQPLPFSKELYPIGFDQEKQIPKVVSSYLLDLMKSAGAKQVFFILREGKWDIPNYFKDGSQFDLNFAYLLMGKPFGAPFSVDQAYSFIENKTVLFGFPDILITPNNVYQLLLEQLVNTSSDVMLGVFKVDDSTKWDMVQIDEASKNVEKVMPKPAGQGQEFAWAIACWQPSFTNFMHQHLESLYNDYQKQDAEKEVSIGEVIQAAIVSGLKVGALPISNGSCLDVGTPQDLQKAILKLT